MAEPPVAGATNATRICVLLMVSVGAACAEGTVAGIVDTDGAYSGLLPTALVAWTVHVYVLPFVSADTRLGEVAPLLLPLTPPSLEVHVAV